jgi:hypothetical protein
MKNTFIATIALTLIAGAAFAESPLSGEIELEFKENSISEKIAGTMGLDLGVDMQGLAAVDLDFEVDEDGNGSLADWTVGKTVAGVGVAFGTDNGVMPGAEGEQTLAAPAMTESLALSMGTAAVAVGFTDWNTDITDISNVQGAYTMGVAGLDVTAAADYNLDSENTVLGAGVAGVEVVGVDLGGTMTYDVDAEVFGFEGVATAYGITAYLNGDDTDALQNVGGEYVHGLGEGIDLSAGANYNLDTEDFAPTAALSFSF